jgi:hypothetical protein
MRTPLLLSLSFACLFAGCDKLSPSTSSNTGTTPPAAPAQKSATPAAPAPTPAAPAVNTQLVKVIVKSDGTILEDGRPNTIDALETRIKAVAAAGGECWYYREDLSGNAVMAERVLQLVQIHNCRLSISTKPDFSTYLDAEGEVHQRQ